MPARLEIAIQRNEDFARSLTIGDNEGNPIDLTGWSIAFSVKERLEPDIVLQSGTAVIADAATGSVDLMLEGPDSPLGEYGDPLLTYELPFDIVATDATGAQLALIAGYVVLSRGISA